MQIAVCDDNELFLNELAAQLRTLPMVDSLKLFANLDSFLCSVEGEGRHYHAVLLDIDWGRQESGLDVAERLYTLCPETKIIYMTGFNDRYSQHILLRKANLSGYLTKPVDPALLRANLQKVLDGLPLQDEPALVLRPYGSPVSLPLREIFYLESRGHTVFVHTAGETIAVYKQLSALLAALSESFVQCHKSFVVNLQKIRRFQTSDILLKNGALVPVSRTRYSETKAAYFRHMGASF